MSDFGFTIVKNYSTDLKFDFQFEKKFKSNQGIHYFFGYNSFPKFQRDKIFEEDAHYIIGLDGVILNLSTLKNNYAISDLFYLLKYFFNKRKENLPKDLKGSFNGFVFDKRKEELFFFNDKVASKQVFYYEVQQSVIISSTIKNIVKFRKYFKEKSYLNIAACYNMLTYGGMIEDQTLIEGVKKLNAGFYLWMGDKRVFVNKYFDFNNVVYSLTNKNEAINQLEDRFKMAVFLEYNKDKEYNYNHLATLSGGLDSRFNIMLANELGFTADSFCFSQSGYLDEIIARRISKDLDLNYEFIALDGGNYLQDLVENVEINNGLQFYLSAAHLNWALKKVDLDTHGLIHTGLAGDGVLGGFLTKKGLPDYYSNRISNKFIDKSMNHASLENEYKNEEVFKLYQRVFNVTNFGSYVVQSHHTYLASPFLDEDFLITALSVSPELKKDQIYLEWLSKKHVNITKYKWEKTGFKPDAKFKTKLSRYTNKIKKEYFIFTKQRNKLSMTPEDYWLESNSKNRVFFSRNFREKIELFRTNNELFKDLKMVFEFGDINEKSAVLTILEIVNKFKLVV